MAGRHADAEARLAPAPAVLRRTFGGEHPLTGIALLQLGYLRTAQGRLADADALLRESASVLTSLLGTDHPMVVRARAQRAELARLHGDMETATREAELTLSELEPLGLLRHPVAVDACRTWAEARAASGRASGGDARVSACLAYAEREFVRDDPRTRALRAIVAGRRPPTSP